MDHLNVHHNPGVIQEILNGGHRLIFQAPYWAVNGAIEYGFNTIHTGLLSYYNHISTMDELTNTTVLIFENISTFTPCFIHFMF